MATSKNIYKTIYSRKLAGYLLLKGFELEEFVIWDRQHEYNNMKTLGYPWVFRFNKVHEFICIYWKRDTKKKR